MVDSDTSYSTVNFWEAFDRAYREWLEEAQNMVKPSLRKLLDNRIKERGLNPEDFTIVWLTPKVEYNGSQPNVTEEQS